MVDWLAGKRVRGTSSERTSLDTTTLGGTGVGGWVELGRTTLGSSGTSISVGSLENKRYLMYLYNGFVITNTYEHSMRMNSDTGSNYAMRKSDNGADTSSTSIANINLQSGGTYDMFMAGYIANLSGNEKLMLGHGVYPTGSGSSSAPNRVENTGKWANTSNAIDTIDIVRTAGVGSIDTGSELVILGWDPDDTHTNNFWEELASVNTTSGDNLSSGTFTAKKYLWVQMYMKYTSTGGTLHETFNNDTGNNYASRDSYDGGTDGTSTSFTHIDWDRGQQDTYWFINQFIINNASNEKLCIGHQIRIDNTHTGAGTAPHRSERVDKWANTSNQITEIDFDNTTAGIDISNGWLKVWGAD